MLVFISKNKQKRKENSCDTVGDKVGGGGLMKNKKKQQQQQQQKFSFQKTKNSFVIYKKHQEREKTKENEKEWHHV